MTSIPRADTGSAVMRRARTTRQKRALADALDQVEEFTSAQDLHTRLRAAGERVGLTTVYTQLRSLADAGALDSVRGDTGEVLYRRCTSRAHHHHLLCRTCGHAVELSAPEVEAWARRLGERHGFRDLDHVVELTGTCARCATAEEG
jgi:Fur family ferric uptake transcriptional regulator